MSQLKRVTVFFAFVLAAIIGPASYAAAEPQRLALVIGQGAYDAGQLPTAANDAGLVAQALTSAGFEVIQGRDLGASDLRRVVRDFLDKAQALEPDSSIVVYLSGRGVQLEGENYLLPVDARIQRDVDVPIEGFRLSDLVRSLERAPAQARVLVADIARDYPLASTGEPLAKGLALMEPPAGFLFAFSSAPNIVAPDGPGPYGAYASAFVEMIRLPGLPLDDVFSRIRLRTHEATKGLQTPWHAANLGNASFVFFEPTEPAAAAPAVQVRRIEDVPAEEAYAIAVERDTIQDYQAFLRRYPDHPLARRVTALLAARREAVVWRRTIGRNTSEAYWTYLKRYPTGPHAADCHRRLARLSAPLAPPPVFEEVVYDDLPPPLPVETVEVVEVVTIIRDAPPPPPAPVYLLPPLDDEDEVVTIIREAPPPPLMAGILPIPAPIPVPMRARPPAMFYQPIAPVTPRGAVAVPVAAPPIMRALIGGGAQAPRPMRAPRPQLPTLPNQPGLVAPIQPIPVSTAPAARPARASRPGMPPPQERSPRLPMRPIPLMGVQPMAPRPGDRPAAFRPGLPQAATIPAAPAQPPRSAFPAGRRPGPEAGAPRPDMGRLPPSMPPAGTRNPGSFRPDRNTPPPSYTFPRSAPPAQAEQPRRVPGADERLGRPSRDARPMFQERPMRSQDGGPAFHQEVPGGYREGAGPARAERFMPRQERPASPSAFQQRPAPRMDMAPRMDTAPRMERPERRMPPPAMQPRPAPQPMAQPPRMAPPAVAGPARPSGPPAARPHPGNRPQECVPGRPCPRP